MIINASEIKNIYVSNRYIDMRKSIDGLSIIVVSQFNLNVLDHSLFIFTNKSRTRIKLLYLRIKELSTKWETAHIRNWSIVLNLLKISENFSSRIDKYVNQ